MLIGLTHEQRMAFLNLMGVVVVKGLDDQSNASALIKAFRGTWPRDFSFYRGQKEVLPPGSEVPTEDIVKAETRADGTTVVHRPDQRDLHTEVELSTELAKAAIRKLEALFKGELKIQRVETDMTGQQRTVVAAATCTGLDAYVYDSLFDSLKAHTDPKKGKAK